MYRISQPCHIPIGESLATHPRIWKTSMSRTRPSRSMPWLTSSGSSVAPWTTSRFLRRKTWRNHMKHWKTWRLQENWRFFLQGFHPFHPQNWGFSQEQMPRNVDFCMNNWDFTTNHESLVGGKTHHFPEGLKFEASKIGVYDVTWYIIIIDK